MAELVDAEALRTRVSRIFERLGAPVDQAAIVADHLVEADLRGVHSHGVGRVASYVAAQRAGWLNVRPNVRVVTDQGGQLVVDGDNGFGQIAARQASELAIERGKVHGLAGVALRGSNHCGAMDSYAIRALPHGLIGVAITNSGINMIPTGGTQKLVGSNALAVAVPTNRAWPLVLDMATSVVAGGKLDEARARGQSIPLGWARDAAGNPTTNPVAARAGSLEPLGGPKGYGLAVVLDVLAGVLSGGRFGAMLGEGNYAQFFLTIDVERYLPLDQFKARMDQLIDQIHQSPRSPDVDQIYLAGERSHALEIQRRRDGIPLESTVLAELEQVERTLGV